MAEVECPCGKGAERFFQRKSPEDGGQAMAYCNRCSVALVQSTRFARYWRRLTREEFIINGVLIT